MSRKAVLAGGSGFIGVALANHLAASGWEVVVLSRRFRPSAGSVRYAVWDGETAGDWASEVDGADLVVNLAGESIAQRWSDDVKTRLLTSRVNSARAVGQAIKMVAKPPKVWINASAIGIYGDRGSEVLTEQAPVGPKGDFLVDLAVAWEAEPDRFARDGVTLTKLRIGQVLGVGGGVFKPLELATRFFLGGHFGSGSQFISWIHIADLCRLVEFLYENPHGGPVNGTAPDAASHRFFMATLRSVMHRPWAPPVPAVALRIVELLGGPPARLLLDGQSVRPQVLLDSGFVFTFPSLSAAFSDLLKR